MSVPFFYGYAQTDYHTMALLILAALKVPHPMGW